MHEDAVAWAGSVLGEDVVGAEPLLGGITSTMLLLTTASREQAVLRLMTEEPWRSHGPALTAREQATQRVLEATPVPAPRSLGLDADAVATGVSAHLMTRLPGTPTQDVDDAAVAAMAETLATIHGVRPAEPFRDYQSWAPEVKWVVPQWSRHPGAWRRAFSLLAEGAPAYDPTFLHRDFGHRNLLWRDGVVSGVVDWVETSTGPADLDAAHAASNLAMAYGSGTATAFLRSYAALTGRRTAAYWLAMDAVGFLPAPGAEPLFGSADQLAALDAWVAHVAADA